MRIRTIRGVLAISLSVVLAASLAGCSFGKKDASTDTASETAVDGDMEYISPDGWRVRYDAKLIEANELDDHSASFVYTGDSAGTNMVTISFVTGKMPEEAMSEITDSWEDQDRTEGYFPGTDDKWGFWRELKTSEEGSGAGETVIGGEYNGGALIFDIVSHKGNDGDQNMAASDCLSGVIDSIEYEDFGPQTMFAYYPGTYSSIDADSGATYSVTLNEDHSGKLSFQDDVDIIWGGYEITDLSNNNKYEYTIEGDNLMLNMDGTWLDFSKGDKPAQAATQGEDGNEPVAEEINSSVADESDSAYDSEIDVAVADYVVTELGKYYDRSDVDIPYINVIDIDDSNPDDVKVYGDFWFFTYKISKDTLETQAGGSYPGCIHLKKLTSGYSVTSMDVTEDGSGFDKSAREIFGDRYQAFMRMHSDGETREAKRAEQIASYVKSKGLMVTKYQDYGWDPVVLQ